jgi:putative ABC transport system permease protein
VKYQGIIRENLRISLRSIRINLLRTILTILIIAFGIMALVGILTAIDSIKNSLNNQFSLMGSSSFAIESRSIEIHRGGRHDRSVNFAYISYEQAQEFKERFAFPAIVAVSTNVTGTATVKYKSVKTNPNINVWGVDENDIYTSGKIINSGRNFTPDDLRFNKHIVIIGSEIAKSLFKNNENPLDKVISIGEGKYKIVGVLKEKGASLGGWDRICLLPLTNARQYFSVPDRTYRINIMPLNSQLLDISIGEAEGLFRTIRRLKTRDENDFNIEKSDAIVEMVIKNTRIVSLAATIIGIITLFGAAIGLMNIMLVSVTERTSEIGIRKALGAKTKTIKQQFLFESVLIGQLGGALGIFLGTLIGNLVSLVFGGGFIMPWEWIITGVILCFVVGVVAGYVPAMKAASVDPIISLRYE